MISPTLLAYSATKERKILIILAASIFNYNTTWPKNKLWGDTSIHEQTESKEIVKNQYNTPTYKDDKNDDKKWNFGLEQYKTIRTATQTATRTMKKMTRKTEVDKLDENRTRDIRNVNFDNNTEKSKKRFQFEYVLWKENEKV